MKNNLKKFKKHYQNRGLFYAIFRGVKYFFYLIGRFWTKRSMAEVIQKGNLRLYCGHDKVHIYWKDLEITKDVGLNTSVYVLYTWHDSSQADWSVRKIDKSSVIVKNRWKNIPITQIWYITLLENDQIIWKVKIEVEENLIIDEQKAGVMVTDRYKRWINSYEEGKFPRANNNWQEIGLKFLESKCIGVKGWSDEKKSMPTLFFDFSNCNVNLFPYIQNAPENIGARMLQARFFDSKEYKSGSYDFFSGEIILKDDEEEVETYIEKFRRNVVKKISRSKTGIKVLLANIPWRKNGKLGIRAGSRWPHLKDSLTEKEYLPFPFFLAYAASLLKKNNIEVNLIDAIAEEWPEEKFLNKVNKISPELLVAEVSTPSLKNDLNLLRKIPKDIKIAICGPDVNIRKPDFLINNSYIDYVLVGEYEYTLLDLVQHLDSHKDLKEVLGLIYLEDKAVKINPLRPLCNLDDLPWPLREGLPMHKYWDLPGDIPYPSVQMLASRGCPYKCNFCLWPQVMYNSYKYRTRNPVDVVDEMEYLIREKGFKSVYFDDDTFNIGRKRILNICREIKKRGLQHVPWAIMARPDLMDKEILTELKSAGLWSVKYGVESAVQELLDNCGKDMNFKRAEDMIRFTKDLGIKVHLTFTFGLLGETEESINQSIKKALELDPTSVQFSITTPYPGTEYFEVLNKKGQIITKDWSKYDGNYGSVIETDNLNASQLQKSKERAYTMWGKHLQNKLQMKLGRIGKLKFNIIKFVSYLKEHGFRYATFKTINYLIFIVKFKYYSLMVKRITPEDEIDIEGFGNRENERDLQETLILEGILNGRRAYTGPEIAEIDLTNQCNTSCLGCWIHSPLLGELKMSKQDSKKHLSFETVKKVIDELVCLGTKEIQFSGSGDPLMHPNIIDILEYVKSKDIKCRLCTNFILADKALVKELIRLRVDHIIVSMWAGTPETYAKLHPDKNENTFYHIEKMLKLLHTLKEYVLPEVRMYNVICNLNCNEIEEMLTFALKTKVDFLQLQVIDIVPGKTESLALSQEDKNSLLEQLRKLREREDYFNFNKLINDAEWTVLLNKLIRQENLEFGRFYKPLKKGFVLEGGYITEKDAVCPVGRRSIDRVFDSHPITKKFVKYKFDKYFCNRCENKDYCYDQSESYPLKVEFLNLLGLGSFIRRISSNDFLDGKYETNSVDSIPCYAGWMYTKILTNGDVVPCCKGGRFPIGNIYKHKLSEIWNSRRYNKFRYKAKNLSKSNSYFKSINCYKSCDNVGMNLEMHKKVLEKTGTSVDKKDS